MSDFFVGEIRLFSFNYAPQGWHLCDGTVMQISQNQALFSLLGTQFGGNGTTTFALPDFRGRVPVCKTTNPSTIPAGLTHYKTGDKGGLEGVTLTQAQAAPHTHQFYVNTTDGTVAGPGSATTHNYLSSSGVDNFEKQKHNVYGSFNTGTALAADSISVAGGNAAHNNMQPSTVLNFCIAVEGLYPSRN